MIPLLADAIEAHGGERRWRAKGRLRATFVIEGELWELKGVQQDEPRTVRRAWRPGFSITTRAGAPVARFHHGNGTRLERINWPATPPAVRSGNPSASR